MQFFFIRPVICEPALVLRRYDPGPFHLIKMMDDQIVRHPKELGYFADAFFAVLEKAEHSKAVLFGYRFKRLAQFIKRERRAVTFLHSDILASRGCYVNIY